MRQTRVPLPALSLPEWVVIICSCSQMFPFHGLFVPGTTSPFTRHGKKERGSFLPIPMETALYPRGIRNARPPLPSLQPHGHPLLIPHPSSFPPLHSTQQTHLREKLGCLMPFPPQKATRNPPNRNNPLCSPFVIDSPHSPAFQALFFLPMQKTVRSHHCWMPNNAPKTLKN